MSTTKPLADSDLPVFLKISARLTGFSEAELEGTGMVIDYYSTLMKEEDHEGVRAFLQKADEVLKKREVTDQEIQRVLMQPSIATSQLDPPFDQMIYEGLARRIILLWYTGVWTTMNWLEQKSEQERTAVVSARAYEQSLIWVTAETHPAGAKEPGFASWSRPPV